MLLGHGAIGQFGVAEALPGTVVNAGTVDVSMGQSASFSIGDETAFGESFQNLINLTVGSPDLQIWNQADDSQSVTWVNVEPGSTD